MNRVGKTNCNGSLFLRKPNKEFTICCSKQNDRRKNLLRFPKKNDAIYVSRIFRWFLKIPYHLLSNLKNMHHDVQDVLGFRLTLTRSPPGPVRSAGRTVFL